MKILLVTDIHEYEEAARTAFLSENPDLVLDCGDHNEINNIFELAPHFYINGNHEPTEIITNTDAMPLPIIIQPGIIYKIKHKTDTLSFSGIGGNYSSKTEYLSVTEKEIRALEMLKENSIDILLLHESPLEALKISDNQIALKVVNEIGRINPKFLFSGHMGCFSRDNTTFKNTIIGLDNMRNGYGVLYYINGTYTFNRIISVYTRKNR